MPYSFNPFTGNLDKVQDITNHLKLMGTISVASDFPTSTDVESGWTYRILADVTDNDATKTNTGQNFQTYDEIIWNGTDWTVSGNLRDVDYIDFDTTLSIAGQEGRLKWNSDDGTLEIGMPGGNVNLQIGQEHLIRAKNTSGGDITNGQVVYITGASGQRPTISLADADTSSSHNVIGVVTEDITNNHFGYVTTFGLVRDINTSSLTEGQPVYLSQTSGALTSTAPTSPAHTVRVGYCLYKHANQGIILVHIDTGFDLTDLHDVEITNVADADGLQYDSVSGLWKNSTIFAQGLNAPTGFENRTDSVISYDYTTRTITVEPTGSSFNYWLTGKRYTVGSGEISETHPNTTGLYFLYFNSSNVITFSTSTWGFEEVPIALVYYDASTPIGAAFDERHDSSRNILAHAEFHRVLGSYWSESGLAIGDYTLSPGSPTDSDNQWSLTASSFYDEDIKHTIPAVAAGSYLVAYRSGADGVWQWTTNNVPLLAGTYAYWNEFTGGSWTTSELTNGEYVNYYIVHLGSVETTYRTVVIMGQNKYSILSKAQGASIIEDVAWGVFPNAELITSYKVTFRASASYTTEGKVRIDDVVDTRLSTANQIVGTTPSSNHNSLSGLQGGTTGEYYHLTSAELTELQAIDTTYVPYTGASADVDIGSNSFIGGGLDLEFSGTSSVSLTELQLFGTLYYPMLSGLDTTGFNTTILDGGMFLRSDPTAADSGAFLYLFRDDFTKYGYIHMDHTTGNLDFEAFPLVTFKQDVALKSGVSHAYSTAVYDNGNSGTSDTIDWSMNNLQKSTLTGNCTFTFSPPSGPTTLVLELIQDSTGGRTVTWPATVKWSGGVAPTLTTSTSATDIISFYYNGTNYFGGSVLDLR